MRIVFMGTPEFAVPSLDLLIEHHYDVAAVVTVPDKPSGRGQVSSPSPVKRRACDHQLPLLQPATLTDPGFIAQLRALDANLFVVVAFRILPPEVFSIPDRGAFNLHASLLPKYRGAAPINWAIINGEHETGVTTFFLQKSVDTGNIILQARIPIGGDETAGELHDRLAEIGAEIVLHTVRLIDSGNAVPKPQADSDATPAPKIFKNDCLIDWSETTADVHNFIRGLSPRPGAFTRHAGILVKIYRSQRLQAEQRSKPGEILEVEKRLVVQAGDGPIAILELQQEGKRRLSAEEFMRGYPLRRGDFFH